MKFIRYSKFNGFDVFGVDLGSLMDALSNEMLDSGYNDDYWWTRRRNQMDDSLDALRQAILQALIEQEILNEQDVEKMLADNDGKFRGSLLEELINKLIERLVEEGYLNLNDPYGKIARWAAELTQFYFSVKYIKGITNIPPDTLSRIHEDCLMLEWWAPKALAGAFSLQEEELFVLAK